MAYCPQCGREVLAADAHVCYYCGGALTDQAPSTPGSVLPDDAGQDAFLRSFPAVLDAEIASITSTITVGESDGEDDAGEEPPVQQVAVERKTEHVRHHAVGFGKGLMMLMMAEAEDGNPDFEYESETYSMAYRWIQTTVDDRREYIRAALQEDVEDE
jgi:hypothetical protein